MFFSSTSGFESAEADPALLAFVKCHITSLAKWEVLRVLAPRPGLRASPLIYIDVRPCPRPRNFYEPAAGANLIRTDRP